MKKICNMLITAALVCGLCACGASDRPSNQPAGHSDDRSAAQSEVQPQITEMADNSQNSLDWAGVYTGVIPAASGPGINVTITLRFDLSYEVLYEYIGRPDGDFSFTGTFKWDDAGRVITLDAANIPPHYQVGEGRLFQLDMEGNRITGELADKYILAKQ